MKLRGIVLLVVVAAVAWNLWYLAPMVFGFNLHEVVPGQVWRSAQPDGEQLTGLVEDVGLRSVLILRDTDTDIPEIGQVRAVADGRELRVEEVPLSGRTLPSPERLAAVLDALQTLPRPLLLHCNWGVERAGLVSALALMLEGVPPTEARAQHAWRYGFLQSLSGSDLPQLVEDYAGWLERNGETHSPELLLHWADEIYVPYFYKADIGVGLEPKMPHAGEPLSLTVRVTNVSPRPWFHRKDVESGVHVEARIHSLNDDSVRWALRTGYEDVEVLPGGSTVWALTTPPLPAAGRYQVQVELVDERVTYFGAMGSPPEVEGFIVRP